MLGYTDHHCLETLLSSTTLMLVILGLDPRRQPGWRLPLLAGVSLGCYLLTWGGGSLVVAVLVGWASVAVAWARFRGRSGHEPLLVLGPMFAVATLMVSPWIRTRPFFLYDVVAMAGGAAALAALWALGRCHAPRPQRRCPVRGIARCRRDRRPCRGWHCARWPGRAADGTRPPVAVPRAELRGGGESVGTGRIRGDRCRSGNSSA